MAGRGFGTASVTVPSSGAAASAVSGCDRIPPDNSGQLRLFRRSWPHVGGRRVASGLMVKADP